MYQRSFPKFIPNFCFSFPLFAGPKVTDYKTKYEYFHKIYKSNLAVPNFDTRDILVKMFHGFLPKI